MEPKGPLDVLKALSHVDLIAHAAVQMAHNGAPEEAVLATAIETYARANAELRERLARIIEERGQPSIVIMKKQEDG